MHFQPNRQRCKRSCRVCQARWEIAVGETDSRGKRLTYDIRLLRKGNYSESDTTTEATPPPPIDTGGLNDTETANDLLEEFKRRCDGLVEAMGTEVAAVRSEAFQGFLAEMQAEAVRVGTEAAAKLSPVVRKLVAPTLKPVTLNGDRHYAYDRVLKVCAGLGQAMLVGPAGTGKSSMCAQMAEDLDLEFGYLPCTEGLSEAHILGRMSIDGKYIPSDFVRIFEKGGVFLFDEVDGADANTLLAINEALANGRVSLPNRPKKPLALRHPKTIILCAANTYGTGADSTYAGRNQLDAAFLDRFVCGIVNVGYDLDRERMIASEYNIDPMRDIIHKIRENCLTAKIKRPVTTRWFIHAGKMRNVDPDDFSYGELIKMMMEGWTTQEQAKALDGVEALLAQV
jgi:MoxR-like ATPase